MLRTDRTASTGGSLLLTAARGAAGAVHRGTYGPGWHGPRWRRLKDRLRPPRPPMLPRLGLLRPAINATLRARLDTVPRPAPLARLVLRLPESWPWQQPDHVTLGAQPPEPPPDNRRRQDSTARPQGEEPRQTGGTPIKEQDQ